MLSHKPDFHLSLTRFCPLRELCTQIRWRKMRYSVASLLTNPVSSSTQPQGIISNTPQKSVGCSRFLPHAKNQRFFPRGPRCVSAKEKCKTCACSAFFALLKNYPPRTHFSFAGWAAPAACSFFKDERVLCCRTIMPPRHDQSIS